MAKNSKKTCGFCKILRKLFLTLAAVCAFIAAVLKLLDYFKSNRNEEENKTSEFKKLCNYIGSKTFTITDEDISGVISSNIFGITTIDLSEASFKEDGFISISSLCGIINIIVPEDVNVCVDGLISASSVNNDAETVDDTLPTLYIASKFNLSAVRISRQE